MKTFFKNVTRETLAGDYLPESESSVEDQQQSSAAARVTVEQFQGYPTLPSDDSDPGIEMTDQQPNPLAAVMQQMQQIQLELQEVKKQQKDDRKKEDKQSYAQTWETCANPETHDPIARVVAKLEKPKVKDGTLDYLMMLKEMKDAGGVDRGVYAELSKAEETYNRRIREFSKDAPTYDGNPKTVFQ